MPTPAKKTKGSSSFKLKEIEVNKFKKVSLDRKSIEMNEKDRETLRSLSYVH